MPSVCLLRRAGKQESFSELWGEKFGMFFCMRSRKRNFACDFMFITWKTGKFAWHEWQKKLGILFRIQAEGVIFSCLLLFGRELVKKNCIRREAYLWWGRKINTRFEWCCHWYFTWISNEMPKSGTKIPVLTEQISLCSGSLSSSLHVQVSFFPHLVVPQEINDCH